MSPACELSKDVDEKEKKAKSVETLPYEFKSLDECTPDYIKEHIDTLKPEESESAAGSRTRSKSPRPKVRDQFTGVNKSYTKLKSRDKKGKMSENTGDHPIAAPAAEPGAKKHHKVTAKDIGSTQFTELEIVTMWNKFKFEFPSGNVNKHQLKTLLRQVFPLCSKPQVIAKNIFRLFDQEREGVVSFRELLLVFTMSMQATPREKLHWLFRIYDIDGNEEIDEDELTEIFMRLYKVAMGSTAQGDDNVEESDEDEEGAAKPPPPPPPPPKVEEKEKVVDKGDEKEKKRKKKLKIRRDAGLDAVHVTTMSTRMANRPSVGGPTKVKNPKSKRRMSKVPSEDLDNIPENQEAPVPKPRESVSGEAAIPEEKAPEGESGEEAKHTEIENEEEEAEPAFNPAARARVIFGDLDANNDGIVDEDEFVEGCLADPNFLFMLEHFSCDFLWGNVVFK